jgi:hypothetical protein
MRCRFRNAQNAAEFHSREPLLHFGNQFSAIARPEEVAGGRAIEDFAIKDPQSSERLLAQRRAWRLHGRPAIAIRQLPRVSSS